jgi:hypothetical protein
VDMAYAPLPQSADKNTLFSRLNLDERVYKLLLVRDRSVIKVPMLTKVLVFRRKPNLQETL